MTEQRPPIPGATYRLQFRKEFGFDDAAALAPYLARLGITHVYASPYLKARPGSTHGYDIVDHNQLNPELGGEEAFARMVAALRKHDLGQILDFVPNHMGVGGADNPRWLDVLAWGQDSLHAGWFDIDWNPDRAYLRGKLLVPFLQDQYGLELERGHLRLKFDAEDGSFAVWAYDTHKLPICPLDYGRILGDAQPELERLGDAFAGLPMWRPQIPGRAAQLSAELSALARNDARAAGSIEVALAQFNGQPGDFASWLALHALIQDQHWRAAHFRVAADDINYRRFFNINDLAGLRMELPEVFEHAHRLVFRLLDEGVLDGLRIDHVDGLLDPKGYLVRLRASAPRPTFYLVVEKILAPHETLREDWPVQGTTGYDFVNQVLGILVDPAGAEAMTRCYASFIGERAQVAETLRTCKFRVMDDEMAGELSVLARGAGRVARQNPRTADFTRNIVHRALKEIVASFPVYRSYVDTEGAPTEADRRDLDWAVAHARRNAPNLDPSVFDFLARALSGDLVAQPRSGFSRQAVLRFAMKLQQYSGPVMAKALEDTAYYRYNRFVALNEVGGNLDQFGLSIAAFHRANKSRAERWPHGMLSTATHDTKRGEDARARLAVLSEIPDEWAWQAESWSRLLRARRGDVEGQGAPDRNDEYLFYQLLLASWPVEFMNGISDAMQLARYRERLRVAMIKSMREAKVHTGWVAPVAAYEEATLAFIEEALDPERTSGFLATFLPFAERIARLGAQNSLVQTVLKLTAAGVPDIYQGTELWDLSLVDPDNRRPVDYALRQRLLAEVTAAMAADRRRAMSRYSAVWQDGRCKLAIMAAILDHRRSHPLLYQNGSYEPLAVNGPPQEPVLAFLRRDDGDALIVAAARFPASREARLDSGRLELPDGLARRWRDILLAREYAGDRLAGADLFEILPVAVLAPL